MPETCRRKIFKKAWISQKLLLFFHILELKNDLNIQLSKIQLHHTYDDNVDQAFSQFHRNWVSNQNSHSQIENDETTGTENLNENDLEDTETSKISAITNFMPKILPDDEIAEGINSLNSKQGKSLMWFIHGLKTI